MEQPGRHKACPRQELQPTASRLDSLAAVVQQHRLYRGATQRASALLLSSFGILSFLGWTWYFCFGDRVARCGDTWELQVPRETYLLPAAALGTAFLHNFVSFLYEKKAAKAQLAILVCYLNAVACLFELLCWFGVIPVFYTADGRPFQLMRYVMWAHATPAMVYVMSLLSDFRQDETLWTVLLDLFMIVTAPLGDLTTGWARYVWWSASCGAFPVLALQLWRMIEGALRATDHQVTQMALRVFRTMTLVLWTTFPVLWLFVQAGYVNYVQEEVMWTVADICGKVLFSCSLLHTNFMTIEDRRLAAMRVIEEANRVKVIHELKELVEQKQQFIALMSHELRTPLNGIIGLSDGLLAGSCGPLDRRLARTVVAVKNSGHRLLGVINDILDAATCIKGELVVARAKVDLHALVDDVAELTRPLLARGVTLTNKISRNAAYVAGDFNRIVQIMHNLLGNAAKFTSQGDIMVDCEVAGEAAGFVEVAVRDTGCGIPQDKLHDVFTSFRQARDPCADMRARTR